MYLLILGLVLELLLLSQYFDFYKGIPIYHFFSAKVNNSEARKVEVHLYISANCLQMICLNDPSEEKKHNLHLQGQKVILSFFLVSYDIAQNRLRVTKQK